MWKKITEFLKNNQTVNVSEVIGPSHDRRVIYKKVKYKDLSTSEKEAFDYIRKNY
jgi:hypothetical protein